MIDVFFEREDGSREQVMDSRRTGVGVFDVMTDYLEYRQRPAGRWIVSPQARMRMEMVALRSKDVAIAVGVENGPPSTSFKGLPVIEDGDLAGEPVLPGEFPGFSLDDSAFTRALTKALQ